MESVCSVVARPSRRSLARGFSLIELIVVLAIIGVVTSIVVGGEGSFNRSFFLTNTAYDIALSIRQAQSYGLSSQIYSGIQNAGYGIAIFQNDPSGYVFFADVYPPAVTGDASTPLTPVGNRIYDASAVSPSELVQKYTLTSGYTISRYCVRKDGQSTNTCSDVKVGQGNEELNIVFARPNSDVTIDVYDGVGQPDYATGACFILQDTAGDQRFVYVSSIGQIAVGNDCSPNALQ